MLAPHMQEQQERQAPQCYQGSQTNKSNCQEKKKSDIRLVWMGFADICCIGLDTNSTAKRTYSYYSLRWVKCGVECENFTSTVVLWYNVYLADCDCGSLGLRLADCTCGYSKWWIRLVYTLSYRHRTELWTNRDSPFPPLWSHPSPNRNETGIIR